MLTFNYGVGLSKAIIISKDYGFNLRKNFRQIKLKTKIKLLNKYRHNYFNLELKNILKKINNFNYILKTYKGLRNKIGLPSRGQRTRTNGKTKKSLKS